MLPIVNVPFLHGVNDLGVFKKLARCVLLLTCLSEGVHPNSVC